MPKQGYITETDLEVSTVLKKKGVGDREIGIIFDQWQKTPEDYEPPFLMGKVKFTAMLWLFLIICAWTILAFKIDLGIIPASAINGFARIFGGFYMMLACLAIGAGFQKAVEKSALSRSALVNWCGLGTWIEVIKPKGYSKMKEKMVSFMLLVYFIMLCVNSAVFTIALNVIGVLIAGYLMNDATEKTAKALKDIKAEPAT